MYEKAIQGNLRTICGIIVLVKCVMDNYHKYSYDQWTILILNLTSECCTESSSVGIISCFTLPPDKPI